MNEIEHRDNEILQLLLNKYEINKNVKDLINFESVFVFPEYYKNDNPLKSNKLYRAILYANIKYTMENDKVIKLKKSKKVSLYALGQKSIKKLSENEVDKIVLELTLISKLTKQLKYIAKAKMEEFDIIDILQGLE